MQKRSKLKRVLPGCKIVFHKPAIANVNGTNVDENPKKQGWGELSSNNSLRELIPRPSF